MAGAREGSMRSFERRTAAVSNAGQGPKTGPEKRWFSPRRPFKKCF
jgi:hypothetical protein